MYMYIYSPVLKSDSSNGVFGFSTSSLLPMTTVEGSSVTVTIIRTRGTFSSVTVSWEVRNTADGSLASDDFLSATGDVTFDEDDIEQVRQRSVQLFYICFVVFHFRNHQ